MLALPISLVLFTLVFAFHSSSLLRGRCDTSNTVLVLCYVVGVCLRVLWWRGSSVGSSTIGHLNFPITFTLVEGYGFLFDLFDSTHPYSPLVFQAILNRTLGCRIGKSTEGLTTNRAMTSGSLTGTESKKPIVVVRGTVPTCLVAAQTSRSSLLIP